MGTETELKLTASPSMLRRTMLAPWLKKAALHKAGTDRPKRQRITSIYFDTSDFALRENGVSLRVRKSGSIHLQTIKVTTNGLITRDEWENEIITIRISMRYVAPMIRSFKGKFAEPILQGRKVPKGFPANLAKVARRKLIMAAAFRSRPRCMCRAPGSNASRAKKSR